MVDEPKGGATGGATRSLPRVLHLVDHTCEGGAQIVILNAVRALSGRYAFTVASLGRRGPLEDAYREAGAEVLSLQSAGRVGLGTVRELSRTIESEGAAIVHAHLLKAPVVAGFARRHGARLVVHDHTDVRPGSYRVLSPWFPGRLTFFAYLAAYGLALHASSAVIVLKPDDRAKMARTYGLKHRRVVWVPNGIDIDAFRPAFSVRDRVAARRKLGIAPDSVVVVMVGRMSRESLETLNISERSTRQFSVRETPLPR